MKNNTQWVEFKVYDKPEARTLLENTKHQLGESAKEAGKRDAESNLPRKADALFPYVGHLLSDVQNLINNLRNLHKADENVAQAIASQERMLQQARNDRDDIQAEYNQQEKEYQSHKNSFPSLIAIIISVLVLLLGLMEGLISLQAIRAFVPHYASALFTALVYGISLTILAHQILTWWNMSVSKLMKWLIRCLIITSISGAFLMMGLLRSGQIHLASLSLEDSTSATIFTHADPEEALLFTLISWLVFLPAVLLTKLTPTLSEWKDIFKVQNLKKALNSTKLRLDEKLDTIAAIQQEIENLKQFEISRKKAAIRDEEDALSLVEHIKSHYIQSNIRYRLDKGAFPSCFDKELRYPLITYFCPSKNQNP